MVLSASFCKAFPGGPSILGAFELTLGAFSLTVLFGPSGCGKTTLLRCLAGLETPDSGSIRAEDQVWFQAGRGHRVPACRRRVGLVFQDSVLFPHLSVAGNIGYGLRGWPGPERRQRVAELMELMGLEELGERRAHELSGGQKQRVALARALAPRPQLVLLDEPFASLDKASGDQLRHNLRHILQALEVPAILVTHDPVEALALGDRLLLMAEGRIVQDGPPALLLAHRGDDPDAQMGAVVRAHVAGKTEGLLRLVTGGVELFAPDPGGEFREAYACIRGEGVSLERGHRGLLTQRNRLAASITGIEPQGGLTLIRLDAGFPLEALITTWACADLQLEVGQSLQALIKASAVKVIPIET